MSRPKPEISKPGIGMSTFMHLQYFHTQILLTILGLLVVVYSSLLKKNSISPLAWRPGRDLSFQYNMSLSRATLSCTNLQ